ncbi:MAG: hypothetical protein UU48_C0002G0024 [Candidatus Uhrbacteria bacterium GW2011_GWF2_41_16]|jgi:PadR family transcriptional regulator PadR|uniref:Transcription regulator PadR N-terminal domain-containing protein n=2 Tax=Candidatus Uhriibacteriota TaxID=1752732 RepID=A0A0G0VC42_9BACT|nr:MAG: hypothetical protein UU31_C0003G0032 [Candidatus Uhrbacteria bacterium GW2011_GWA2_41_10]KKR87509.1 MAG: hypothetical protein UU35_C0002G0010 [Candidatus Uhrbacteria bacterium GW2011_GWC2_41_11]KKR98489.1 MAG: hypothetical protein UU48_C0002G0024 [Candidatus Uhrbacteria bacterium GW2011_GWF2_41_16]HBO99975.1 PadR family transcriptional regulator [Candidatus Uhrbacteria bacterium]
MNFSKETIKGAADLIVLKILENHGESYGYQLIRLIETESDNIFSFKEGTLYPLLYRMEEHGYVTSTQKTTPSGKMRRYYKITSDGKQLLKKKTAEWQAFTQGLENLLQSSL